MSQEKTMLLLLKGHISELPAEQQELIWQFRDQLKQVLDGSAEALLGLSLLTAEIAVEQA
jgi:hypothetical protein